LNKRNFFYHPAFTFIEKEKSAATKLQHSFYKIIFIFFFNPK
jgi:hypothetical protein